MLLRMLVLLFFSALVIVPVGLALVQIEQARQTRFFGDQPNFLRHIAAPRTPQAFIQRVKYRPVNISEDGHPVPRVFLATMPQYLAELDPQMRKDTFTATVLPLVLRVNELILNDRERLLEISGRLGEGASVSKMERRWIQTMANTYDVEMPDIDANGDFAELLRRVDAVPPSLALAQAAIESGWGTSRFARTGNALYGQWTWSEDSGLIPLLRGEGLTHRIRAFDYLLQSVYSYTRNLNTHAAYEEFRAFRSRRRIAGQFPSSLALTPTLSAYSERGVEYVNDLQRIIRSNRLEALDQAKLEPLWWASR